jgi:hypothetical protein
MRIASDIVYRFRALRCQVSLYGGHRRMYSSPLPSASILLEQGYSAVLPDNSLSFTTSLSITQCVVLGRGRSSAY